MDPENTPSIHLSKKIREQILNGNYADLFTWLPPQSEKGNRDTQKVDNTKKGKKSPAESSFINWLVTFCINAGIISVKFRKRASDNSCYKGQSQKEIFKVRYVVGIGGTKYCKGD